ncbi:MAG: phosphonate C-P lyase system protein PhnH [Pseudomonadota bacterium]|jgi:alpha-D-ribose 1-methylphosphonate 5-triphosphate synthase subunit PhnH
MTTVAELPTKFAQQVLSAQSIFRSVMDAMARPGSVHRIASVAGAPAPLMPATAGIALTLFDHDTPIWLDPAMEAASEVAKWLKFHTSAPLVADPSIAHFALVSEVAAALPLDRFAFGSSEYPDRSTTLIVQVAGIGRGSTFELRGPGIDGAAVLQAPLGADLVAALAANHALFPRGVDLVLVADDAVVALPRTTRLVAKEN